MKTKTYYTLAVWHDSVWAIEFGDYDRECVQAELEGYADHPSGDYKRKQLKIVTSGDQQWQINDAIRNLKPLN